MTAEITPETLRLASNGAGILEFYCRLPEAKAVWELVAHATEMQAVMKGKPTSMAEYLKLSDAEKLRLLIPHGDTCEWKEGKDRDDWQVGCDASRIWWHSKPSMLGMKLCPYCGKRLIEKPLALTETKRPATTGEVRGEK